MFDLIPWRKNRSMEMSPIQHEINRLFEDFFRLPDVGGESERAPGKGFMPAVDVRETDKEVLVEAELPGIDPKEVQVEIENDALHVRGERTHEEERKRGGYVHTERYYGRFERYLPLPDSIDKDKVEAAYKNGVLKIKIAKRPDAAPRKIDVKVA